MQTSALLVGWGWSIDEYLAAAREIEELGFDACYIGDDLFAHQAEAEVGTFEPWTMLGALAVATHRMKIGSLVSPVGRRHPGLFAKITTTADLLSGGRLIVGMGTGNSPEQYRSLSQPFLAPRERVAMLSEELEILQSMWSKPRTDFEGEYYTIRGGLCEPKPARNPHPEILLGVLGRAMISLAGRFADRVNCLSADDSRVVDICRDVRAQAAAHDRDGDAIVFSRLCTIMFTDEVVTDESRRAIIEDRARQIGKSPQELVDEMGMITNYIGAPGGCAEWAHEKFTKLGLEEIVLCIDTVDTVDFEHTMSGLRTFANQVMPSLRGVGGTT